MARLLHRRRQGAVYRPRVGESFAFAEDLAGKRRQLDEVEKDLAADATASLQLIAA